MSETTPDPADVHTGTDRVELTDDEREQLWQSGEVSILNCDHDSNLVAAVESIVAAHVQALTAERDEWKADYRRERDTCRKAQAELAAANARCAELGEKLDRLSTEIMDQNAEKWGDQPLTDDEKALLLRFNALSVVLDKSEAKNAALQATLDRVTAAIKSSKHKTTDHEGTVTGYLISDADLRAALTPEGKCKCGHAKADHSSRGCNVVNHGSGCEIHGCTCPEFREGKP